MTLPAACCLLLTALLSSICAEPLPTDPLIRCPSPSTWRCTTRAARPDQDQTAAPRHAVNGPEVDAKNLHDDDVVTSPFVLSLGVRRLGVAPAGETVKDTGYFAITVTRGATLLQKLALTDGRTGTVVDLPGGEYDMASAFMDGGGRPLLRPASLRLMVAK